MLSRCKWKHSRSDPGKKNIIQVISNSLTNKKRKITEHGSDDSYGLLNIYLIFNAKKTLNKGRR